MPLWLASICLVEGADAEALYHLQEAEQLLRGRHISTRDTHGPAPAQLRPRPHAHHGRACHGAFMAECGCDAVKLEGGRNRADVIKALVNASIPVVGHIGFTPQAMTMLGGFTAPAQDMKAALRLVEDARVLEDAGICMLVLEAVPADLAATITERAKVPVCGFGSGPHVDGQVLLLHDMVGLFDAFTGRFSKRYVDMGTMVTAAISEFVREVESGTFPAPEHYAEMPRQVYAELERALASSKFGATDDGTTNRGAE